MQARWHPVDLSWRGRILTALVLVSVASPSPALGQSFGVVAGNEYGFGATARIGPSAALMEVGAGFAPLLVFGTEQVRFNGTVIQDDVFLEIFIPVAVGAKMSLRLKGSEDDKGRVGLKTGVTYNSLMRFGFGGGMDFGISENAVIAAGLMYYPEADDELAKKISEERGYPPDAFDLSFLVEFQFFVSVSLLLF